MKKINQILMTLSLLLTNGIGYALAVSDPGPSPKRISEMVNIIDRIFEYIFPIAGLICVIFIIVGGYMWMISAGDPAKAKQAQGTLTWAVVGLIFTLLSIGILKLIVNYIE